MARSKNIFTRVEKKYVITDKQLDAITPVLLEHMKQDEYGLSTICSVYYDTPDRRIIRASINAKAYKEKLRMRCYGLPNENSRTFVELKKKYKGIVYKRRIDMPYSEAIAFLSGESAGPDVQIAKEIKYALGHYPGIRPAIAIFCERIALFDRADENLRLTIDRDLRYRMDDVDLMHGSYGTPLLPKDKFIMEIKTAFSMPLWLVHLLDEHNIYPGKFSKYGTAFNMELEKALTTGESALTPKKAH